MAIEKVPVRACEWKCTSFSTAAFFFSFPLLLKQFPVESCLAERMCETMNAEISIGTINSLSDAVGFLRWTFYARRLKMNPTYYGATSSEDDDIESFLLTVVQDSTKKLEENGCINIDKSAGTDASISTTPLGRAASNFYLNHATPKQMLNGARSLRKVRFRLLASCLILTSIDFRSWPNIKTMNPREWSCPNKITSLAIVTQRKRS